MNAGGGMNARIANVFTLLAVGFGGIVVMLTWWQVVVAGELRQMDMNNQTAYYEQRVQRGLITTADGVRLATRTPREGANADTIWERRYPERSLAAHVLGYDSRGYSRAGVERALNDALTGSSRNLGAVVGLLDGDEAAVGDNVQLTIDAGAQRVAERALAATGSPGAAVAVEVTTGRVVVMASHPTFAPADVLVDFEAVAGGDGSNTRLFNRATQAAYPPGSTFKVLTAAAALEDGIAAPDRSFPGGCTFATTGPAIANFGGACFGRHDLETALTRSINTTFAQLGVELGAARLREQMAAFGFFEKPPLEGLPTSEVRASGLTGEDGRPLPEDRSIDQARTAIGQDKLTVSPLQMALVVAAIGNRGVVPEPTLVQRITRPGGRVVARAQPRDWKRAISPETAASLLQMMRRAVDEGSGTAARIPGVQVAGKTGTADAPGGNITWFVALAPADAPRYAVAVAVEGQSSGITGGAVSAPIARDVLVELLGSG
jgi:penicillin-binding protein A